MEPEKAAQEVNQEQQPPLANVKTATLTTTPEPTIPKTKPDPDVRIVIELDIYHNATKPIQWVALARSHDPTRCILQTIHIEATDDEGIFIAVATDGRRLHAARIAGVFTEGNYRIVHANKSYLFMVEDKNAGNYPNWKKVIPKHKASHEIRDVFPLRCQTKGMRLFNIALKFNAFRLSRFDLDYLVDAVGDSETLFMYQEDRMEPVFIRKKTEDGKYEWAKIAVVMPFRSSSDPAPSPAMPDPTPEDN